MIQQKSNATPQEGAMTYSELVLHFIGHMLGTAAIFLSFAVIGWFISIALLFLNSIRPFPAEIWSFLKKFELYLIYGDSVLCALLLVGGAYRFVKQVIGMRN